jgi:hypothetical protein
MRVDMVAGQAARRAFPGPPSNAAIKRVAEERLKDTE